MFKLKLSPNEDILCLALQNWLNAFLASEEVVFSVDSVHFAFDSITFDVAILESASSLKGWSLDYNFHPISKDGVVTVDVAIHGQTSTQEDQP